ncbi:MAG: UDP binding domain-containing protein [Paenisporosarcina sp.]
MEVQVTDLVARDKESIKQFGIKLIKTKDLAKADAVIFAVPHREYIEGGWDLIEDLLKVKNGIVVDIKSLLDKELKPDSIDFWRL